TPRPLSTSPAGRPSEPLRSCRGRSLPRRRALARRVLRERRNLLLELRDPSLERTDALHALRQLVDLLSRRLRVGERAIHARRVAEPAERVLARVGEPREDVLVGFLGHRATLTTRTAARPAEASPPSPRAQCLLASTVTAALVADTVVGKSVYVTVSVQVNAWPMSAAVGRYAWRV